jgi:hypothetical protein
VTVKTTKTEMMIELDLPPGESIFVVRPRNRFRVETVKLEGDLKAFRVLDIMVGKNSQLHPDQNNHVTQLFLTKSPVEFESSVLSEGLKLKLDTVHPWVDMAMKVLNTTAEKAFIRARYIGSEEEEEGEF